ncbi:MAG: retention module-containing protein [Deltaproteobacteria bacterium]|nr:retention module-containing protein [Deltaproteobacteria bacterium]
MAQIAKAAGTESQAVGKVFILYGTVQAVSPDGTVRVLAPNSPIFADEHIITGSDGSVSIQFDGPPVTQLDLGRMTEIVIDQDVYAGVTPEVVSEAAAQAEQVQESLLQGDQPIDLEATAAGGTTGAGGGHPTVNFALDGSEITVGSGAGTTGITTTNVDTLSGVFADDHPTIIATSDATVDETGGLDTVKGTLAFNFGTDGPGAIVLSADGATWNAGTLTLTATDGTWQAVVNGDGTYTFTQLAAMDHPDTTNPDDVIKINITATVTDVDGDSVSQGIVINVLDDGPSISIISEQDGGDLHVVEGSCHGKVDFGHLDSNYGEDGAGTIALSAGGATWNAENFTLTADDGAWKMVLDPESGEYTFTLLTALDHSSESEGANAPIHITVEATVTDADGDTASAPIDIQVDDAGPQIILYPDIPILPFLPTPIDESGGLDTVHGILWFSYGPDGAGTVELSATGATWDENTDTLLANDGTWKMELDNNNFSYTFTQLAAIDHPNHNNPDDPIFLNIKATVTDSDGSSVNEWASIRIDDDGPSICHVVNLTVDETGGLDTMNGHLDFAYGADGPADIGAIKLSADGASWDGATNTLTGAGGAWTMVVTDTVSGAYTFTQLAAMDHPNQNNPDDHFHLDIKATVTDGDGDSVHQHIDVRVFDDGPTAANDVDSVTEGLGHQATGNVFAGGTDALDSNTTDGVADNIGADGPHTGGAVTAAYFGLEANAGTATFTEVSTAAMIHGTYGDLVINPDGTYTYTLTTASIPTDVTSETFTYQITDGDGDTDLAQLVITLDQDANIPDVTGSTGTVYEDGLADGVQHGATSETTTGTFTVDGNNEGYTLTLNGTTITAVGNTVNTGTGVLGITSISAPDAGGVVTYGYQYTLSAPLTHTGQGEVNPLTDTIAMSVTNATGGSDATPGSLVISIVDDVPIAVNEPVITAGGVGTVDVHFIVDVSGSMTSNSVPNVPGFADNTLGLARYSMDQLLTNHTEIQNVQFVTFNDGAAHTAWMTRADALTYIEDNSHWNGGGTTDYDKALTETINNYGSSSRPAGQADQTVVYFLSDGEPNTPGSNPGITNDGTLNNVSINEWEAFVTTPANDISNVFAIGLGTGVDAANINSLEPIAYPNTDTNPADGTEDHVVVVDSDNLSALTQTMDNLLVSALSTGDVTDNDTAGADGFGSPALVQVSYDADGLGVNPAVTYDFTPSLHSFTINLGAGRGTLVINDNGDYTYTPPSGTVDGTPFSVQYTIHDADGDTSTASLQFDLNSPPTTGNVTASGAEDAASIAITLNGSDADGTVTHFNLSSLPADGTLHTGSAGGPLAATGTDYLATGNALTLYFVPGANFNGTASFQYAAHDNDGGYDASPATATITVDAVNDGPVIGGMGGTLAYTENASATIIDTSGVTVADIDSANFNGGSLTVSFTANGTTADQLGISSQGTSNGQISVSGSTVYYNPAGSTGNTAIGTFTGGTNGSNLVINFNSNVANPEAVEALIQRITYANNSDNPSTADRTVTFTLNDGDGTLNGGINIGSATATIDVTAENDAPNTDAGSGTGSEDAASIAVSLSGTDIDGTVAFFKITELPVNGTLYSDAGLTTAISLNGTVAAAGNLATVYFDPAANFNGSQTFHYAAIDNNGAQDGSAATATITVTPDAGPVANADTILTAVNNNATFTVPEWALLNNDTAGHDGPAAITSVSESDSQLDSVTRSGSIVSVDTNGTFDPPDVATFSYVANDGSLNSNSTPAIVTVKAVADSNITGTASAEIIVDSGLGHTVNAGDGNDIVFGNGGDDTLNGEGGNDILVGGIGKDTLTGGTGADKFVFSETRGASNLDHIVDYSHADGDKIDLSGLINIAAGKSVIDYVKVTQSGSDITVLVDPTGAGSFSGGEVVVLNGCGTAGSDPLDVLIDGTEYHLTI